MILTSHVSSVKNDRFLRACRREPVDCTPVWFLRQAGRYLPEYRAIRAKASLLEICRDADLCAEVTLQPVERLGVDAAILFADILLPLAPMGAPFHFAEGEGPVIERPVRDAADVARLAALPEPEGLEYVFAAIREVRKRLDGRVPLIGFAGAPFTLASYLVEAGESGRRSFVRTKTMMLREPKTWHALMERLSITLRGYLREQVTAGAQAVQLFDSWVGCLSAEDYRDFVLPHSKTVLEGVRGLGVPVIHFGVDTGHLLPDLRAAGADVIGIDWKTDLAAAAETLGPDVALQGNLDPVALLGPVDLLARRAKAILHRVHGRPGHVFNVGHGLLPQTDPEVVAELVGLVHAETQTTRPR